MKNLNFNILFTQVLLVAFVGCNNQKTFKQLEFKEKCEQLVLSEKKTGQEYLFKRLSKSNVLEYRITYLGEIENKNFNKIIFLNCVVYTGLYEDSKRASGAIMLYDTNSVYFGMYQIGSASATSSKAEGSNLIFSYDDESCNQTTTISFKDSIPQQIFINCTKNGGDLYSFTKE